MRALLRKTYLDLFGAIATPKNGVHIINSHYISDKDVKAEVFYKQLEAVSKHVTFIGIEEAVSLIDNKQTPNQPLVAFTYDDGFEECYTKINGVLKAFDISAAFFVNPNFIDGDKDYNKGFLDRTKTENKKPMTWQQVNELIKEGHIIGAHTMDHLDLGMNMTNDQLQYQLGYCKTYIEEKTNNNCNMFAFPYGQEQHLTNEALELAKKYYQYIFSGTNYKNYYSFNNTVINRRHCEPNWSVAHFKYFLNSNKKY
ncbi:MULTISPECIES: polysaccharide deacetylase family protein [Olleya]|uniref:polysaccharide deacetylase family protein n=1 Tax=Olleya TaxID=336276 RepID=UPI000C3269FE|nr:MULTISPECIES: polysaccharide deacetylase family protein [Olleya]PKG52032.1 deacetylase [Olleya sp. 1-3]